MTLDAPKINKRKRHSYFVRHHLRKRSEQTAFGFGFDSGIPSFVVVVVGLRPGLLITHLKNDKSADKRENRRRGERPNGFLGLTLNEGTIPFLVILLDKTV